jgi:hypothetical protein
VWRPVSIGDWKIMSANPKRKTDRLRRLQERMGAKNLQDVERTRRFVEREGLTSVMNQTKWEALVAAMRSLQGFTPRFRPKCVRAVKLGSWDHDWYYYLRPFSVIEWVDIDPIDSRSYPPTDRTLEIEQALRAIRVSFSRQEPCLRVWGYVRPGVQPEWA